MGTRLVVRQVPGLELTAEAGVGLLAQPLDLLPDQGLGQLELVGLVQGVHHLALDPVPDGLLDLPGHVGADLLTELFHAAVFDAEGLGEVLVHGRQGGFLDLAHLDGELGGLARQVLGRVTLREGHVDGLLLAGPEPRQLFLEGGQHLPRPQFHRRGFGLAPFEGLPVQAALEIHDHLVAGLRGTVHGDEGLALAAQALDHLVHIGLGDLHLGPFHGHLAQVGEHHLRVHFEGGHVFQALARFHALRLDARAARRLEFLLGDGLLVGTLQHVAHHLLEDARAVALLHHLQGHLARAEAVDTDALHQGFQAAIHLLLDALGRDLHGHPALQVADGFH
jgi:hypothetical protein